MGLEKFDLYLDEAKERRSHIEDSIEKSLKEINSCALDASESIHTIRLEKDVSITKSEISWLSEQISGAISKLEESRARYSNVEVSQQL